MSDNPVIWYGFFNQAFMEQGMNWDEAADFADTQLADYYLRSDCE